MQRVFWKCVPKALREEVLQSPFTARTRPKFTEELLRSSSERGYQTCCCELTVTFQTCSCIPGQDYKAKIQEESSYDFQQTSFHPHLDNSFLYTLTEEFWPHWCPHSKKVITALRKGLSWGSTLTQRYTKILQEGQKPPPRSPPRRTQSSQNQPFLLRKAALGPRPMNLVQPTSLHLV